VVVAVVVIRGNDSRRRRGRWTKIMMLSTETFYVKLPREPQVGPPISEQSEQVSPAALRIRALSLQRECTAPPTDSTPDVSRLLSLTTITSNIVALSRQLWVKSCDQGVPSPSFNDPACAANRESAFTAGLMASAALIYLSSHDIIRIVCLRLRH